MPYELTMPNSLDLLHLILAGLSLLLLILVVILSMGRSSNKASVALEPVQAEPVAAPVSKPVATPAPRLTESDPVSALQLLGLFQQEARLVDFLQESLDGASDDQVGAVARVVHEGGRKVLGQYFELQPVRQEVEETQITLAPGFDAAANRVTGNVSGEPPFTGILLHTGWRVTSANLPKLAKSHDPYIIAPAEVEL